MSERFEELQEQIESKLKEIDEHPSLCIELSDTDLVEIVGGAYMNAVVTKPASSGDVCTCPERCCNDTITMEPIVVNP